MRKFAFIVTAPDQPHTCEQIGMLQILINPIPGHNQAETALNRLLQDIITYQD